MLDFSSYVVALALAALISSAMCWVLIRVGPRDAPDGGRKDQLYPIPTSGGLAIALAVAIAMLASVRMGAPTPTLDRELVAAALGAGGFLMLGFADDVRDLPASLKLALQIALAVAIAWAGVRADTLAPGFERVRDLPMVVACAVAMLWIVVLVNAVNFMDGSNGLAMGMAAFVAMGLAGSAALAGEIELAVACGALLGGLFGFLVWNMAGRLFAGDAGALFVGGALASLSLLLVRARPDMMFVPLILASPFLVDVFLTLIWRARRGARLFEAHRDHVYQIALKAGLKHWHTALAHWLFAANCAALGFAAAAIGRDSGVFIFIVVTLIGAWVHVRVRRAALAAGLIA